MSEVLRFRIARAPKEGRKADMLNVPYPRAKDPDRPSSKPDASLFLSAESRVGAAPAVRRGDEMFKLASQRVASDAKSRPEDKHEWLASLNHFVADLDAVAGRLAGEELDAALQRWVEGLSPQDSMSATQIAQFLTEDKRWSSLRVEVGDSLIAQYITNPGSDALRKHTRQMQALGLIESLARSSRLASDAAQVARHYLHSVVILPSDVLSTEDSDSKTPDTSTASSKTPFVRRPAFTDLVVVKEEWSCYVAGEIAHIENVLQGERKVHEHILTEETETTETTETSTLNSLTLDQQTTERNSLQQEASKQTSYAIGVDGQVDVSAGYGPMDIATHLGASLNYSVDESQSKASETSKEIVSRSVEVVETQVKESRSTRNLLRVTERNTHLFDNRTNPNGPVVGLYRWVDKINRLQNFTYPHRFVMEFQLPEPAAWYRWAMTKKVVPDVDVPKPPSFTMDDKDRRKLKPSDVERNTFMDLVARFSATGIEPPPEDHLHVNAAKEFISDTTLPAGSRESPGLVPTMNGTIDLVVPEGYKAVSVSAALSAAPLLFKWKDQEISNNDNYQDALLGYHLVIGTVAIGGRKLSLLSADETTVNATNQSKGVPYRQAWLRARGELPKNEPPETGSSSEDYEPFNAQGKVTAVVTIGGAAKGSMSISLKCELKEQAYKRWQLETFEQLRIAHDNAKAAYDEAVANATAELELDFPANPPDRNAEIARDEIKRLVIEQLLGKTLMGYETALSPVDDAIGPVVDLDKAQESARLIQFVEQAFEWSNITYVLYPYYWADRTKWADLSRLQHTDTEFLRFLQAGSARVVLPARPGFEWATLFFSFTGKPWLGGAPPMPDDALYVSVAQEIQEQMDAPDDGLPGDAWEVRMPTTLITLDADPTLPKCNEARVLVTQPVPDLCGAGCATAAALPAS